MMITDTHHSFHTSRVYKYKKVKMYMIEITLLQGSVQKKIV